MLPRHTYPFPPLTTGAPLSAGPLLVRLDHLIMLAARWRSSAARASVALSHAVRPRTARHHRAISVAAQSVRDRCPQHHAQGLRAGVGDRRHRRLSGAVGQPAGHADVRDVGDVEGADRHDDRRAGLDPRRDCRRSRCSASSRSHSQWLCSGRRFAISPPMACCSSCWCCGRAACFGTAAVSESAARSGRGSMDDYLIGVLSNIGMISFVALSAYLLLLTGEISFGQQAFFAIGAYAAGIATAMWGWPFWLGARVRARRQAAPPPCWSDCRRCGCTGSISPSRRSRLPRWCGSCSSCSAIRSCDRRRAGRAERHRGFPQYPLHLRERCRARLQFMLIIYGLLGGDAAGFLLLERSRLGVAFRMIGRGCDCSPPLKASRCSA